MPFDAGTAGGGAPARTMGHPLLVSTLATFLCQFARFSPFPAALSLTFRPLFAFVAGGVIGEGLWSEDRFRVRRSEVTTLLCETLFVTGQEGRVGYARREIN